MSGLLDFLQSASNTAASNVSAPVDGIAWLLRKAGVPVGDAPVGGSDWMAQNGLTRPVQQSGASLAGETLGLLAPIVAAAKAPQIAGGLLQMADNAMAPRTLNPETGAIVWHGSPHKFDKFDSSKIGTGEGAQAYGHGLYLAESPDVAKAYRSNLVKDATFLEKKTGKVISKESPEYSDLLDMQARMERNGYGATFDKKYEVQDGAIYKVDLPDEHIAKMLDWDKPLSQQPQAFAMSESLQKARAAKEAADSWKVVFDDRIGYAAQKEGAGLIPIGAKTESEALAKLPSVVAKAGAPIDEGNWLAKHNGGQLINSMNTFYGPDKAAEILRQQGIPGIRYLDGGSRGAGAGTSNYVVFPGNEDILKILERNGQGLLD